MTFDPLRRRKCEGEPLGRWPLYPVDLSRGSRRQLWKSCRQINRRKMKSRRRLSTATASANVAVRNAIRCDTSIARSAEHQTARLRQPRRFHPPG